MATSVCFQEQIEIPFLHSLVAFRQWVTSADFLDGVRVDYIGGRIEVDMSPEDLFTHGNLKTKLIVVLGTLLEGADLGNIFSDCARVTCPDADLSCEPDIVVVFHESLATNRVQLVAKASGERDRYIELQGAPELVIEIVSESSVTKDTQRLPDAYWRAGIPEFWLADARGSELLFTIHRSGPAGYEPARLDTDGFQYSGTFNAAFRLSRHRHPRTGHWTYDLERKLSDIG
ncbi:MAG: Uma2 family endonuclease [Pirellulaceae bacterium]